MVKNYIVYQAYGSVDILNEVIYSVASIFKKPPVCEYQVVIYTDNTGYLSKYLPSSIIYEDINAGIIKNWRGEIDFVHRVKIMMLKDFSSKYHGNALYLDTDTIFIDSPDRLFEAIDNGLLVMHVKEGLISDPTDPLFRKIFRVIKSKVYRVGENEIKISADQEMWNAGVLGFSSQNSKLLDVVLSLTDSMYTHCPKHVMEQLAFSYIFSLQQKPEPGNACIFHYWNFKEFREVLSQYLSVEDTFDKILANYHLILPTELIKPKQNFESKPKIIRQFSKYILHKTWPSFNYIQSKG